MQPRRPSVPGVFRQAITLLEDQGTPYVLVGGLAAGLQGQPRYTNDVDLMITLPTAKVSRFAEDMLLFKMSAWQGKDISDAQSILARHRDQLDLAYVRQWTSWFAAKNEAFREMPARLQGLLGDSSLPPAVPWP